MILTVFGFFPFRFPKQIVPVCAELSCQLRNIIKQYVARCTSSFREGGPTAEQAPTSRSKRLPVIITGGDGKFLWDLLKSDASRIVSVEPDASPVPAHAIDIRHVRNLVTYAVGDVLYEKHCQKPRNDPEERLRLKIQGLRIAAPAIDQKEIFSRGCVFHTTPESMIEGYVFHARFDNGVQKDLTLRELYGVFFFRTLPRVVVVLLAGCMNFCFACLCFSFRFLHDIPMKALG